MNLPSINLTPHEYVLAGIIGTAIIAYCIHVDKVFRRLNTRIEGSVLVDPYIEQVRAMRAMPGTQPGVAVSIQDTETGEFYYYPRDSEIRMKRDHRDRLWLDV